MTPASAPTLRLLHGTTRRRAESILAFGPDPNFVEPGGTAPAEGFSTAPVHGPYPLGAPDQYAAAKAVIFPDEGGPAILEIEIPTSLAALSIRAGGEFRFEHGCGLDELLEAWPSLPKKILPG